MNKKGSYDCEKGTKETLQALETEKKFLSALDQCELSDFRILINKISDDVLDSLRWNVIEMVSQSGAKNKKFIEALLEKDKKVVNTINKPTGKAPIHYAVEEGNYCLLQILIQHEANPNLQNKRGETALHIILKKSSRKEDKLNKSYMDCFQYLLTLGYTDLNIPDDNGNIPIRIALVNQNRKNMDWFINELSRYRSKLQWTWMNDENEIAQSQMMKLIDTKKQSILISQSETDHVQQPAGMYQMFYWIKNGFENQFCENLTKSIKDPNECDKLVNCFNGYYTYLQYACKWGMVKAVKLLLSCQADPNKAENDSEKPIELACIYGHPTILQILLQQPEIETKPKNLFGRTLLHHIAQTPKETNGQLECLKILLKSDFNVEACDKYDRTPLHYAVINNHENCVRALLDYGANVNAIDTYKQKPLTNMSQTMLKTYLDSKVRCNNQAPKDRNYCLIFDYKNLLNEKFDERQWTKFLIEITRIPALQYLVSHPIFSTIIYFKWDRIRWLFYTNLVLYLLFCFTLTAYILIGKDDVTKAPAHISYTIYALRVTLVSATALLMLLELIEIFVGFLNYISNFDNILRVFVLVLTITIISGKGANNEHFTFGTEFCAVAVLFTWFELFLVLGKQPSLTFYVNMFRVASETLLKFVLIHSFLIIAFGLSFHTLFRENKESWFSQPQTAIFKTIIMVTGEYNAEDIDFDAYKGVSHFLFIAFIFIISIVLINLLIGLAGSATKQIEDNRYLYSCMSEIYIISHYESTYFVYHPIRRMFDYLFRYADQRKLKSRNSLFLYPNATSANSWRSYLPRPVFYTLNDNFHYFGSIDREIIKNAQEIVEKNKEKTKAKETTVADLENKITLLEDEIKACHKKINEISNSMEGKKKKRNR